MHTKIQPKYNIHEILLQVNGKGTIFRKDGDKLGHYVYVRWEITDVDVYTQHGWIRTGTLPGYCSTIFPPLLNELRATISRSSSYTNVLPNTQLKKKEEKKANHITCDLTPIHWKHTKF